MSTVTVAASSIVLGAGVTEMIHHLHTIVAAALWVLLWPVRRALAFRAKVIYANAKAKHAARIARPRVIAGAPIPDSEALAHAP